MYTYIYFYKNNFLLLCRCRYTYVHIYVHAIAVSHQWRCHGLFMLCPIVAFRFVVVAVTFTCVFALLQSVLLLLFMALYYKFEICALMNCLGDKLTQTHFPHTLLHMFTHIYTPTYTNEFFLILTHTPSLDYLCVRVYGCCVFEFALSIFCLCGNIYSFSL